MAAIYRSGSQRVSEMFFEDFSLLLESLAMYNCAFYVVGDVSIHFERPDDVACQRVNRTLKEFSRIFISFIPYILRKFHCFKIKRNLLARPVYIATTCNFNNCLFSRLWHYAHCTCR